jgi:hypothetical protein
MKKWTTGTASYLARGAMVVLATTAFAADTHLIGTNQLTWTFSGKASAAGKPLVVDTLKKGDIVEVNVSGNIPHGFVTTKRDGQKIVEFRDAVVACKEDPKSKPNAVMREIDCGSAAKFGVKSFKGPMRLEVLQTFGPDLDFHCTIHTTAMPGTLKLKP